MNRTVRVYWFWVVCTVSLMIASVKPADAMLVTVDAEQTLYSIDRETAAVTRIGHMEADEADIFAGLAYDSTHDILYATTTGTNRLYSIDYTTGKATLIGDLGASLMHGLAYDPCTVRLLGTFGQSKGDGLYSIDVSTGAATLIGRTGFFNEDHLNTVQGLAVHPKTHVLYGIVAGPAFNWSALIEIDMETAQGTWIGRQSSHISGLAFDAQTNLLYGIDNWTSKLYTIDLRTGAATLVGSTGLGNPLGLEDVVTIPEPATVVLLAIGFLALRRKTAKGSS
jgi:DNA-binding beta-propeller fold protein YncE